MWICQNCETPNNEARDTCGLCNHKRVMVTTAMPTSSFAPISPSGGSHKPYKFYTTSNIWWKWLFANVGSFFIASLFTGTATQQTFILVLGLFMGLFQWLVLRQFLFEVGWWIFCSTITLFISFSVLLSRPNVSWFIFAVLGAVVGIVQWLLIKKHDTSAWKWVFASAFSWGLLVIVEGFISYGMQVSILFVIDGSVYSVVTGWALVNIFKTRLL